MLPVSILVPFCPGLHEFLQPQGGAAGPFLPASGNQAGALLFLSRAPLPPRSDPGVGLLVPLTFPILHTSTLYIFGSQEESRGRDWGFCFR